MGGPPLGVRRINVTLTFTTGQPITRVTALDENGYAADAPVTHSDARIQLRDDAIWHIIER